MILVNAVPIAPVQAEGWTPEGGFAVWPWRYRQAAPSRRSVGAPSGRPLGRPEPASTRPRSGALSNRACLARSTTRSTFLPCSTCTYLSGRLPWPALAYQDDASFPAAPDDGSGGQAMAVLADAAPSGPVPGPTLGWRWTVVLPAVQRGVAVVSARPCRRHGCPQRRAPAGCQCPPAASAVHTSGPSMSAGGADLARNPSRCPRNRTPRQCPRCVWECGRVLAGRPLATADTAAAP